MGENIETDVAFSYLADIKKKFLLTFSMQQIQNSYSYQLKSFSDDIKKFTNSYTQNPVSKITTLKNNISQTSEVLHENIEKLIKRNEKLDIIAQKSSSLMDSSDTFYRNIHKIKMRQKYKKLKYLAMFVLLILFIALLFYVL